MTEDRCICCGEVIPEGTMVGPNCQVSQKKKKPEKGKKMKLPSKEEVRNCIQIFLMLNALIWGFWFQYVFLWFKLELPQEWWSLLVCLVLGMLSTYGLFKWIARN